MSKCNSGHKVERSGKSQSPMAKDMRRKAKGSSDESRIKKEKRNIQKGSEYVLIQLNIQQKRMAMSKEWWARCHAQHA